jgi:hypothetical protein
MKFVAGHQPNLYPYAGFFAKLISVDEFVIVDNVQYVKKEYHNRNMLKFSDGTSKWLSIPVKNSGRYKQDIKSAEIDDKYDWRKLHLRTLELNYRKTAFFDEFFPSMRELFVKDWTMLSDYNIAFIRKSMEYLGITTPLTIASEKEICGEAHELILDICRKTGAESYLHGIHGLDYVDFDFLSANGVASLIQVFVPIEYPQMHGAFIPNLSILDVIFNCGKEGSLNVIQKGSRILDEKEARKSIYLRSIANK